MARLGEELRFPNRLLLSAPNHQPLARKQMMSTKKERRRAVSVQKQRNRERRTRERVLDRQRKDVAIRAKYGPRRRPAPVIVKTIDGEFIRKVDQQRLRPTRQYSDFVEEKARQAGFKSYEHYLNSPHWLDFRRRALSAAGYKCQRCPRKDNLAVHHLHYNSLNRESLRHVRVLCPGCHRKEHGAKT